jgi:hypothetical protein
MRDIGFLIEFCRGIFLHHEKGEIVVLDSNQIAQLNFYFKSDTGHFNLSFPAPDTLVIHNNENIIEYVHHWKHDECIVSIRKQISILEKFIQVDLNGRAVLLHEFAEFLSTKEYYSMKVSLYSMPGFLVELFYSPYLNKIERIEVLTDLKRLNKHLENIEINELFR